MAEKTLSVLIIEDETVFRTLALQIFEGFEKSVAFNAEDGLEKFKEISPDITLLDIGLPDQNGLDLLPQLIAYNPEAFIVMLTMSRVSEDVRIAKEEGAAGYIIKPFSIQKIQQCINKYYEYRKQLQNMTPDTRADNILKKLKTDALHDDLNQQAEQNVNKHLDTSSISMQDTLETKQQFLTTMEILLKQWRILFVDELLVNRDRAKMQISQLGCTIDLAEDINEAINKVHSMHYNIILISSRIKGKSGYDLAKDIRQYESSNNKEQQILIAMVDNANDLDRHLWQKAGMNGFIKKPASFTKIKDTIRKHAQYTLSLQNGEYIK